MEETAFGKRTLGRTGIEVGPLGLGAAYGAPAASFEKAFERGCNYFYFGASRHRNMAKAVKNLVAKGKRDEMVIAVQSFTRSAWHLEQSILRAMKRLGVDYADILILGWHNSRPSARLVEKASQMRQKGLVGHLGLSGHNRRLFPDLAGEKTFDMLQVRYNAAHRGAEWDVFPNLPKTDRPAIVSFTATCWGKLMNPKKMPSGESPASAPDCYRFVLSNKDVDLALTGPKNAAQMDEALLALEKGPLNPEEMERMKKIGDFVHQKKHKIF